MARHRKAYTGERRTVHLGVQLTPSERAELKRAAAEAGACLSQYVRELCLRRTAEAATVGGARRNPDSEGGVSAASLVNFPRDRRRR